MGRFYASTSSSSLSEFVSKTKSDAGNETFNKSGHKGAYKNIKFPINWTAILSNGLRHITSPLLNRNRVRQNSPSEFGKPDQTVMHGPRVQKYIRSFVPLTLECQF